MVSGGWLKDVMLKDVMRPHGSKRFWQACLTCVKIACFNPDTVATLAWETHPTIKEMMISLIIGVYSFPPIPGLPAAIIAGSIIDCDTAAQMLAQADANAIDKAKLVVAQTPLQENDKIVLSMQLDNAILMDPSSPARQPTAEVYDRLRARDLDSSLGYVLRRSRAPDFLLETIRLHGADSSKCVTWLLPILEQYPETVHRLPEVTISQMLLVDLRHQVQAERRRQGGPAKKIDLTSMVAHLARSSALCSPITSGTSDTLHMTLLQSALTISPVQVCSSLLSPLAPCKSAPSPASVLFVTPVLAMPRPLVEGGGDRGSIVAIELFASQVFHPSATTR